MKTAIMALAITFAQQPANAPPVKAPPVKSQDLDYPYTYAEGQREAKIHGKRLVVFVNCQPRHIEGLIYVAAFTKSLKDFPAKCIVITEPGGEFWKVTMDSESSSKEILDAVKGVSRKANFFQPLQEALTADVKISDAVASKVPAGVRFYNLRPLYQEMFTMSSRPYVNYTPIEREEHHPFIVSGGMAGLKGWRSDKGLLIPNGEKITVWRQYEDVRAFAPVDRWRWQFPVGTVAFDVLSTDKGVFEVRTQTRDEDGWQTKVTFKDEESRPTGYRGLDQSCSSCHSRTGEIVDVPGRIYRRERWGSDGRFSWRPYDESGNLIAGWPLEVK